MPRQSGTKYACPHCDEAVTVFVALSEPPYHQCGGSPRADKTLPLLTPTELKAQKSAVEG